MSGLDDEIVGAAKEVAGEIAGDDNLVVEGATEKTFGEVKEGFDNAGDDIRGAAEDAGARIKEGFEGVKAKVEEGFDDVKTDAEDA